MRLFVNKLLRFSGVFLLFAILSSTFIYLFKVDYKLYHKDTNIEQKLDTLFKKDYNVLFFGSSTTFRHFNPSLFDLIDTTCNR